MRRRHLLAALPGLAVAPAAAQPARVLRVGWLTQVTNTYLEWFLRGMRDLGYQQDATFVLLPAMPRIGRSGSDPWRPSWRAKGHG